MHLAEIKPKVKVRGKFHAEEIISKLFELQHCFTFRSSGALFC